MTADHPPAADARPLLARLRSRLAGVRIRTTLVAILVVAVVLVLAVTALAVLTRDRLESSVTDSAENRAADVAALVSAGALGDSLPRSSLDLLTQVVDADGNVIAASPGIGGLAPFTAIEAASGIVQINTVPSLLEELEATTTFEDEGPYKLVVRGVAMDGGTGRVIVAASLDAADEASEVQRALLLYGLPLVLVAVGIIIWSLTGRALRPVDAMRQEAETISASALERRLPVPESQDEVHRLAQTLNAMLDRLQASSVRQQRFIADASHELKSPVAAIRTMLEVAETNPDFADWRQLIADLKHEDGRLELLVGDLLTLARSDEGGIPVRRVEIDLDQIVGREAEAAGTRSDTPVDTSGIEAMRMWGDPNSLAVLFRNLLDNAARYAVGGVWVASSIGEGHAVVRVSDDGPGIPEAERERVFERFVRLDEARSRADGGTGLGLAVARAIAHRHGGDVVVASPTHGGTTMEVRLAAGAPQTSP